MAKTIVVFFVCCLVGLWIQCSVVFTVFGSSTTIVPDLILVLVCYLGLHFKGPVGVIGAFALGLLSDFASAQYVGPNAAGMVIAFVVVMYAADKVFVESSLAIIGLAFMASIGKSIVFIVMFFLFVKADLLLGVVGQQILLEALFTALLAPFVIKFLRYTENQLPADPVRMGVGY